MPFCSNCHFVQNAILFKYGYTDYIVNDEAYSLDMLSTS